MVIHNNKEKRRLPRLCSRCQKRFQPNGRFVQVCDDCRSLILTNKRKKKLVKIVKKIEKNFEHEIDIITNSIGPRIQEVCSKFERGVQNEATMFAFWIGMNGDLNSALKKIEKRNKKK